MFYLVKKKKELIVYRYQSFNEGVFCFEISCVQVTSMLFFELRLETITITWTTIASRASKSLLLTKRACTRWEH